MVSVNKEELAMILKTSPSTVSRLIAKYGARFPCIERGRQGVEWLFDAESVLQFLAERAAEARNVSTLPDELLSQLTLPGLDGVDATDWSVSDLLRLAKLRRLLSDESKECAFLVSSSELAKLLNELLPRFRGHLGALRNEIYADHNIPHPAIAAAERRLDEAWNKLIAALAPLMGAPALDAESAEPRLF